ncbi:hypothetical protein PDESU_05273 [Pontiella desulfatans]|uniref:DUF1573 domain-containing protein n=2 Tax=Pontiella desulfatans TaxID=2750659 RepID=A0A6C2U992_PONDE|nr:hypothetical protein PDESU_05273 [Pontiella desulfatans]
MFLLSLSAEASLEWEQKKVSLEVHPSQVSATAVFRFENAGEETIALQEVKAGCGCLSSRMAKETYVPGEKGLLEIKMDLRNRTGKQKKTTTVRTSDGRRAQLMVEVNIPQAYRILPRMVTWHQGDDAESKSVRLVNDNKLPIKLQAVRSSHGHLAAELKTIREGYEYEVAITRKIPDRGIRSFVRIIPEPPPGQAKAKELMIYAHVQ